MFFRENLNLGQYKEIDTVVHKLDTRIKLISLLILVACAFTWQSGAFLALTIVLAAIKLSKLPYRLILKWLFMLKWFLIFTFVFHLFATPGHYIFALSGEKWGITYEGLSNGFLISLRLVLLLMSSSLLTLTTSPSRLVDGLEKLLNPLKKVKIPVQDISMMIMLSLHFIPILWQEADRILKAQIARGVDFYQGNIFSRIKHLIPMTIPLVLGAFRRADNLALAMEIRHYHSQTPRTSLYPNKLHFADYMTLAGTICLPWLAQALEQSFFTRF